jgi:hypothetical protein
MRRRVQERRPWQAPRRSIEKAPVRSRLLLLLLLLLL